MPEDLGARSTPKHESPRGAKAVDEAKLRRVELAISIVLRVGVVLSVLLVSAGLGLTFYKHSSYLAFTGHSSYHPLTSLATRFPHTLPELFHALAIGDGRGLIGLGLIVLILTPVMRVGVGVLSFAYEKDPPMVVVTLFVLFVLVGSFFIGGA